MTCQPELACYHCISTPSNQPDTVNTGLKFLFSPGLDHTSVKSEHNDITQSEELLEHYLYLITDCLARLPNLVTLNLGSLVSNNMLRVISNTCAHLRELRLRNNSDFIDNRVSFLNVSWVSGIIAYNARSSCHQPSFYGTSCVVAIHSPHTCFCKSS